MNFAGGSLMFVLDERDIELLRLLKKDAARRQKSLAAETEDFRAGSK